MKLCTTMLFDGDAVRRAEAMAAVPAEYIDTANLLGPAAHVQERLGVYAGVGVTHLIVNATGARPLDDLAAVKSWLPERQS